MTHSQKFVIASCLAGLLVVTGGAVYTHGAIGIFRYQLASIAGIQVLLDLVIALGLFIAWMWQDARKNNRNPWGWTVAVLVTGSIAALGYLLLRNRSPFSRLNKPSGRNRKPRLF